MCFHIHYEDVILIDVIKKVGWHMEVTAFQSGNKIRRIVIGLN